jgi:hypothetical protein
MNSIIIKRVLVGLVFLAPTIFVFFAADGGWVGIVVGIYFSIAIPIIFVKKEDNNEK